MIADEIRNMEAGREMDALAAEKVMGWERHGNEDDGLWIVPPVGDERRTWCAEWDARGIPDWMPNYSTDIAAAWEVILTLENIGFVWNAISGLRLGGAKYGFMLYNDGKLVESNTAPTVPLAVCRAALLAVMGDGE